MNGKQIAVLLKNEQGAQAGDVIALVIGTFAVMFIAVVLLAPLATTIASTKGSGNLSASDNSTVDILNGFSKLF